MKAFNRYLNSRIDEIYMDVTGLDGISYKETVGYSVDMSFQMGVAIIKVVGESYLEVNMKDCLCLQENLYHSIKTVFNGSITTMITDKKQITFEDIDNILEENLIRIELEKTTSNKSKRRTL